MSENNHDLKKLLEEASAFHGHICAGIVLGTRMSLLGLEAIGINDPKGEDSKNLIVYVEMDRCASDAILTVTGCHPGKRSLKILDYGKMAATFVNLKTGKAVRVVARDKNDEGKEYTPEMIEQEPHTEEYAMAPAQDLFEIQEVTVDLRPEDMPGKPLRIVMCASCGERVMDMREVRKDGTVLCRPCAQGARYYKIINAG
jgi:formylmethanofuran dehydrogenase subunit E